MKYIINGRFLTQKITGVQRYAREIVAELDKICSDLDIEIAIPSGAEEVPHYANISIVRIGKRSGVIWEQTTFARYVKQQHAISINLCNSMPLSGKKIVAIHDVKVKAHPEFFSWKFRLWYNILFRNAARRAKAIITVSEFSKEEIIKYYHCNPNKIHVIYNAWQHYCSVPTDRAVLVKFQLTEHSYVFALGSLEPNKNLKWILESAKMNPDERFIVGGGINKAVFAEQKWELPKNVCLIGYLSDIEAKTLMQYCKAFVFPSFYEGFGIPPMEAMVAGAPKIIVSDIPVMHEIFGDSVRYIDPYICNMAQWGTPAVLKDDKKTILDKFSWGKSAIILKNLLG